MAALTPQERAKSLSQGVPASPGQRSSCRVQPHRHPGCLRVGGRDPLPHQPHRLATLSQALCWQETPGKVLPSWWGRRSWWAPVSTSTNDHLSKLLTSALSISHQGPEATTRTSKSSTRPDQVRRPNKHLGVASSFLRGHLGTFPCHQEQPPIHSKSAGAGRRGPQGLPQCKPQDPRVVHTLLIAAHQVEGQGSEKAHSLPGDT